MAINPDKIIAELVKDVSTAALAKGYEVGSAQYRKALVVFEMAFKKYLVNSYKRYSKIKTLLYRDRPVDLRAHYVPSDFQLEEEKIRGHKILGEFFNSGKNIVVGTAGSGKSVLLRRLFLDLVEGKMGVAPVLVELRLVESTGKSNIFDYIYNAVSELEEKLTVEQLHYALKNGKIFLLLDGFDEIDFTQREYYEQEILEISRRYPDVVIVVSSRPDECFSSWEEFHIYKALPLDKSQAADLVGRIEYDATVKEKFIKELRSGLYERHEDFLSNPLLLTMMLLTYEQLAEIPEKIHIFYEQAFDTLFHKHDALKSLYKRKSYTGLPVDDFKRLFSAFCVLTYSDRKLSFSLSELLDYIAQAIELESLNTDAKKFFDDLIKSVCIIQKDGNVYTFTHRSFQEYFAAYFISRSQSLDFPEVLDSLLPGYFRDSVIPMLFALNREQVERHWVLPKLRSLVPICREACDTGDFVAFLEIFYVGILVHGGVNLEADGIGLELGKIPGYFSSLLVDMYRNKAAEVLFEERSLEERQAIARRDAEIVLRGCLLNQRVEDRRIPIEELPRRPEWISETSLPQYCSRKLSFLEQLFQELDKKYRTKERSLKSLLRKNVGIT